MDVAKELGLAGIIPVVVIENEEDALPTARALCAGGVRAMEITMRTPAALKALARVAQDCPEMLVGAGTVLNIEQGKACKEAGARFLVSPGLDEALVRWCLEEPMPVIPGCVTPSEIMKALQLGLHILKFFPANVYGGLAGMKALAAPFGNVRFVPTGGIGPDNLAEYAAQPFVHAVGGSWLCTKGDIAAHRFERITEITAASIKTLMGFELRHVGINAAGEDAAEKVARQFCEVFGFGCQPGVSSLFAGSGVEVMRSPYLGKCGHIAMGTFSVERAAALLSSAGCVVDWDTAKYKGKECVAVYLRDEIGGFAVHLVKK